MNPEDFELTSECPECGTEHAPDEDGYTTCYGNPEDGIHARVVIWKPCAMCGRWIDYLDLCRECSEDYNYFDTVVDPMHGQPVRPISDRK